MTCLVKKQQQGSTVKLQCTWMIYWIIYVNMVHMYHAFSPAIRSGMYVTTLKRIANYFFALNHTNNAR